MRADLTRICERSIGGSRFKARIYNHSPLFDFLVGSNSFFAAAIFLIFQPLWPSGQRHA